MKTNRKQLVTLADAIEAMSGMNSANVDTGFQSTGVVWWMKDIEVSNRNCFFTATVHVKGHVDGGARTVELQAVKIDGKLGSNVFRVEVETLALRNVVDTDTLVQLFHVVTFGQEWTKEFEKFVGKVETLVSDTACTADYWIEEVSCEYHNNR